MVGVCMTVLSIAKLIEGRTQQLLIIDELMAIDSLVFLLSAGLSYQSIKAQGLQDNFEKFADISFMAGLTLMAVAATVFAYELY